MRDEWIGWHQIGDTTQIARGNVLMAKLLRLQNQYAALVRILATVKRRV